MPPKRGASSSSASPSPARSGEVDLKLICVGQQSTGKSTFLKNWETKELHPHVKTTIQMEFHKLEMDVFLPPPNVTPSASSFTPPQQTSAAVVEETSPSLSSAQSSPSLRDDSKKGSLIAPFRLAVPETRTNFGPGTEARRAIVKVWDIQGQENVKSMTRIFYTGSVGALVFCSVNTPDSLDSAILWKKDIDEKVRVVRADGREQSIPCWLVVNKYDVIKDSPISACPPWASRQQLDLFVEQFNFVGWSYAAGLKGINVAETVSALVSRCVERFPEEIRNLASGPAQQSGGIQLSRTRRAPKKQNNCCP